MDNSVVLNACRLLSSIKGIKLTVAPFNYKKSLSAKKLVTYFATHHQCSLSLNKLACSKLIDKQLADELIKKMPPECSITNQKPP